MAEVLDSFDHHNKTSTHVHDRAHVFHSWSAQALINPLPIARTEGSWMWDYDDNKYLDFSSQLVNTNIGHQHPKVIAAIQEQAATLVTIAPATANLARGEAAKRIYYFGSSAFFFGVGEDLIGLMLTNELKRVARVEAVDGEELARCWQAGEVALREPGSEKCMEPVALEECRSLRGAEKGWAVHVVEDEQGVAFAFALAQDALGL